MFYREIRIRPNSEKKQTKEFIVHSCIADFTNTKLRFSLKIIGVSNLHYSSEKPIADIKTYPCSQLYNLYSFTLIMLTSMSFVAGESSAGKSSLLNLFLGENILPAHMLPCTSCITVIKYNSYRCAKVSFKANQNYIYNGRLIYCHQNVGIEKTMLKLTFLYFARDYDSICTRTQCMNSYKIW